MMTKHDPSGESKPTENTSPKPESSGFNSGETNWVQLITSVKTLLGFAVLVLLISQVILLVLLKDLPTAEKAGLARWVIGLMLGTIACAFFAAIYRPQSLHASLASQAHDPASFVPSTDPREPMMSFDGIERHVNETFDTLERRPDLLNQLINRGNGTRLFDSMASGILAAAQAVPKGVLDATFFANLMELTPSRDGLVVRSFLGTYSDQVVKRIFSLDPDSEEYGFCCSVASTAQVRAIDSDGSTLRPVKGERDTLRGLWSVPVIAAKEARPGEIVVVNINSLVANAYAINPKTMQPFPDQEGRERKLKALALRLNALRRRLEPQGTGTG